MKQFQFDSSEASEYKSLTAYGLIGDSRTAVLVGADGAIDWACLPDFDSPSVFGALLDPSAGTFAIRPAEPYTSRQHYERGTNVLVTEFSTADGTMRVRDYMPYSNRKIPTAEIYRRIEGVSGEVDVEIVFAPKFRYGAHTPVLEHSQYGVRASMNGDTGDDGDTIVLSTEIPMDIAGTDGPHAVGRARILAGEETCVVADWGARRAHPIASYQCDRRLWQVRTFWRSWIDQLPYHGRYRGTVERSLLTLKLLTYEPTGAIVAAPTTSMPEWIGGARNWDYRYSWVRDSAFILRALFNANYMEEGTAYFDWLLSHALEDGPLRVMYGIRGERNLSERTLDGLRGYRDSKPVRIGNGAADQLQLDIYGSLLDAALRYDRQGGLLTVNEWEKLEALANEIYTRWEEPDMGIWEIRSDPQHFTYSKVWAWVGLTRAVQLARQLGADSPTEDWKKEAEKIRHTVLEKGWNPRVGAFTQSFGSDVLDASVMVMPSVGFIPADDDRFKQTMRACVDTLQANAPPLLYRYLTSNDHSNGHDSAEGTGTYAEDGVGGEEGAFLLPSFWMVEAMGMGGDLKGARASLATLMKQMNPLGLYSEEIHPENGDLLGNFPQGFSHLGQLNAIFRLEELKRQQEGT